MRWTRRSQNYQGSKCGTKRVGAILTVLLGYGRRRGRPRAPEVLIIALRWWRSSPGVDPHAPPSRGLTWLTAEMRPPPTNNNNHHLQQHHLLYYRRRLAPQHAIILLYINVRSVSQHVIGPDSEWRRLTSYRLTGSSPPPPPPTSPPSLPTFLWVGEAGRQVVVVVVTCYFAGGMFGVPRWPRLGWIFFLALSVSL